MSYAQKSPLRLADSLHRYGKYSKAIKVLETSDNKSEAYPKIASNYLALGNTAKAISFYQQVIKIEPNNELNRYQLAKLYRSTKAYNNAKDLFLSLIDSDYKNPNYHFQLGKVYKALNDDFSAQSRFRSTYDLDSTHLKAIYELSKHAYKKGHHSSFNSYVETGLAVDSTNKGLISLKAQYLFSRKNYREALELFKKLLVLNENTSFVNKRISDCHYMLDEYQLAISFLEIACNFEKNNIEYLFRLGELHQKLDEFKQAETYYELALILSDRSFEKEYTNLGIVLNRQKKHEEAINAFKKALKFSPNSESIQFYIVNSKLEYYKDHQSKVDEIKKYQERFPNIAFSRILDYKLKALISEDFHKTD